MTVKNIHILTALSILLVITLYRIHITSKSISDLLTPVKRTREATIKEKLERALKRASENKKIILYWNAANLGKQFDRILSRECGSCRYTTNDSLINDRNLGAVIIHFSRVRPKKMPPSSLRRPDQLYVWRSKETPINLKLKVKTKKLNEKFMNSFPFNCTWTYRRDSDIYSPYFGKYGPSKFIGFSKINGREILKQKSGLALAVISHCEGLPGIDLRLKYIARVKSTGFKLDTRGKCFESARIDNVTELAQKYKFYFAFENSYHCRDYITEKFFNNSFISNTVPVALGAKREDYEAVAPPHSFIHVEDFSTLYDLLDYLKYLDNNNTAYLEYFKWKTMSLDDFPIYKRKRGECQLCRIINGINIDDVDKPNYNASSPPRPLFSDTVSKRTALSFTEWYFGTENKDCYREDLFIDEEGRIR